MLVHFDLQVGLIAHLPLEQVGEHGVRSTAMVGQIDGVEVRMVGDQFCTGQNMLSERIVKVVVLIRDIQ